MSSCVLAYLAKGKENNSDRTCSRGSDDCYTREEQGLKFER